MRHHHFERGGLAGKSQGANSSTGFPKLRRASLTLYFLVRSFVGIAAAVVRRVVARPHPRQRVYVLVLPVMSVHRGGKLSRDNGNGDRDCRKGADLNDRSDLERH